MTATENERLASLEASFGAMREDVGEIKAMVSQLVATVQAQSQRGNDRHAKIEADLAVLKKDCARYEKALWVTGSVGGGALLGHAPTALTALAALGG